PLVTGVQTCALPISNGLKVPHMGWNQVRIVKQHPIFEGVDEGSYFYFVHSYYPQPADPDVVIGETEYGVTFASVIARDNIVATQDRKSTRLNSSHEW